MAPADPWETATNDKYHDFRVLSEVMSHSKPHKGSVAPLDSPPKHVSIPTPHSSFQSKSSFSPPPYTTLLHEPSPASSTRVDSINSRMQNMSFGSNLLSTSLPPSSFPTTPPPPPRPKPRSPEEVSHKKHLI